MQAKYILEAILFIFEQLNGFHIIEWVSSLFFNPAACFSYWFRCLCLAYWALKWIERKCKAVQRTERSKKELPCTKNKKNQHIRNAATLCKIKLKLHFNHYKRIGLQYLDFNCFGHLWQMYSYGSGTYSGQLLFSRTATQVTAKKGVSWMNLC